MSKGHPIISIYGGGDVPMFEPVRQLNFNNLDKSRQKLKKIYREKLEWFDIPDFAQKIY
jgi:hypothetical protein